MALRMVSNNYPGQDVDRINKRITSTTSIDDKENSRVATGKFGPLQNANKLPFKTNQFLMPEKPAPKAAPKQEKKEAPVDVNEDESITALTEAFSSQMLGIIDIDADDSGNPQLASEYVGDIYNYLRSLETATAIQPEFMKHQTSITPRMRGILVDWLIQVHGKFQLLQETLYLTVAILDRYLQVKEVAKSRLQLVGVTALLLASKYEEMYTPEINDCVYITDKAFTSEEIRAMERSILRTLDFNLGRPVPLQFLRRNSKAADAHPMLHVLSKYLIELTLAEYECSHLLPSIIAAAAICLSMKVLDNEPWSKTMVAYSRYAEKELFPVMQILASLVMKAEKSKLKAVYSKYSSSKLLRISMIPELKGKVIMDYAGVNNKTA